MSNMQAPKAKDAGEYVTATCGSVTVVVRKPSEADVKARIRESAQILERLLKRIQTLGIKLDERNDVPIYYHDPADHSRIFRKLHGKSMPGSFVNGKFQLEDGQP